MSARLVGRPRREESRERLWVEHAELDAGRSGVVEHALMRLAAGERAYGDDRWATVTLDELLGELSEEAADIGAWGALALEALERSRGGLDRGVIAARVYAAILWGAYAHLEIVHARLELKNGGGNPLGQALAAHLDCLRSRDAAKPREPS